MGAPIAPGRSETAVDPGSPWGVGGPGESLGRHIHPDSSHSVSSRLNRYQQVKRSPADLIGLDTVVSVADSMYDEYKEPLYAAPPLLKRMVAAGRLGRKSGAGFYTYG